MRSLGRPRFFLTCGGIWWQCVVYCHLVDQSLVKLGQLVSYDIHNMLLHETCLEQFPLDRWGFIPDRLHFAISLQLIHWQLQMHIHGSGWRNLSFCRSIFMHITIAQHLGFGYISIHTSMLKMIKLTKINICLQLAVLWRIATIYNLWNESNNIRYM